MTTSSYPAYVFKWKSPDGTVYVFVTESTPLTIQVRIGKAGTSIAGWAYAVQELINLALQNHSLSEVIDILNGITTHQATFDKGVECRSTAEAIAFSLMEYERTKKKEAQRGIAG